MSTNGPDSKAAVPPPADPGRGSNGSLINGSRATPRIPADKASPAAKTVAPAPAPAKASAPVGPIKNFWTRLRGHKPAETRELAILADKLDQLDKINNKVNDIAVNMERMGIAEYVEMLHHPRRLLWANFLIGLARGFGMAVGFALLGALALYFLQQLVLLNMPLIGDFIADIVALVQQQLKAN